MALYITLFLGANVARGGIKNPEEFHNPVLDRTESDSTEEDSTEEDSTEGATCSYVELAKEIKVQDIFHFVANAIKKTNGDSDLTAQHNTQQDSEEKDSDNSRFKLWSDLAHDIDGNLTLMDVIASTKKNIPMEIATPFDDKDQTVQLVLLNLLRSMKGDKTNLNEEEKKEIALLLDESFTTRMTFKKDNQTLLSIHYYSPNPFKGIKYKGKTESEKKNFTTKKMRENMEKFQSLKKIQIKQQHHQFRDLIIEKHGNKKNNQTWKDCKSDKNSFVDALYQDPECVGNEEIYAIDSCATYGALDMGMILSFVSGFIHFTSEELDKLDKEESENSEPKDETKATTEETEKTASCSEDTKEPKNIASSKSFSIDNDSFNALKNGEISLTIEHKKTPQIQHFLAAPGSTSDSKESDSEEGDYILIATVKNTQQVLDLLTLITTKVACQHLYKIKEEQTRGNKQ